MLIQRSSRDIGLFFSSRTPKQGSGVRELFRKYGVLLKQYKTKKATKYPHWANLPIWVAKTLPGVLHRWRQRNSWVCFPQKKRGLIYPKAAGAFQELGLDNLSRGRLTSADVHRKPSLCTIWVHRNRPDQTHPAAPNAIGRESLYETTGRRVIVPSLLVSPTR